LLEPEGANGQQVDDRAPDGNFESFWLNSERVRLNLDADSPARSPQLESMDSTSVAGSRSVRPHPRIVPQQDLGPDHRAV
jgi:hypothetical protein